MYEVIYYNKILNKKVVQTFWSKREATKFIKAIKKNKHAILMSFCDNSYMYDQYQFYIDFVLNVQYNYIKEVENER